jgi:uncharacterized protein YbaR (Trm112 family)
MFIELVDALRCPEEHEESWLVLSPTRIEARHVLDGTLGCHVCRAEYVVRDGIADLRPSSARTSPPASDIAVTSSDPEPFDPLHLAAIMNLGDPLGFAVLIGTWGRVADGLRELPQSPPLVLVNPPGDVRMQPGLSGLRSGPRIALADGSARAIAVDASSPHLLESAVRATRAGGRVVAPAAAALPPGVRELARDDEVWVAEREAAASPLVTLHVRRAR